MPAFDRVDNLQGHGESTRNSGMVNDGYGEGVEPSGVIDDTYGDQLPLEPSHIIELIRKEAALSGVKLPHNDNDVARFAARAAYEAQ